MKKIIPIIAAIGAGAMLSGCNSVAKIDEKESLENQIQSFQNQVEKYSSTNKLDTMNTKFRNYSLSIMAPDYATRVSTEVTDFDGSDNLSNNDNESTQISEIDINQNSSNSSIEPTNESTDNIIQDTNIYSSDEQSKVSLADEDVNNEISTLYSLSSDISESCDDFCQLKEEISQAIVETQNLINKVQSNELSLTAEQRMFITEQAKQLKSLGKQLSNITTELSINLSDISSLMRDSNGNIDNLSLKYLVVLDNLVNGNEMLENGLQSLYMINSIFNSSQLAPNNQGRILYGFKRNDEPPIIKDYTIENGEIKETEEYNDSEAVNSETTEKKGNIDTYLNTNINKNIDTLGNKYNNIDTFFNTAFLDNELYGNGYGMNMYGYGPYQDYNNRMNQDNNTKYGVNNNNQSQDIDNDTKTTKQTTEKKKFKITSNIDTYRDQNTPTVSAKFTKMKESVSNFLSKFKPRRENPESPIYKLTDKQNAKND